MNEVLVYHRRVFVADLIYMFFMVLLGSRSNGGVHLFGQLPPLRDSMIDLAFTQASRARCALPSAWAVKPRPFRPLEKTVGKIQRAALQQPERFSPLSSSAGRLMCAAFCVASGVVSGAASCPASWRASARWGVSPIRDWLCFNGGIGLIASDDHLRDFAF